MMNLSSLISEIDSDISIDKSLFVSSITSDSRKVVEGSLFLAVPGEKSHGALFIDDAISRGATSIIFDQWENPLPSEKPIYKVPHLRQLIPKLSQKAFGSLGEDLFIVGVTGTNGKSTTVDFVMQLANHLGYSAGRIGTLGVALDGEFISDLSLTTPDYLTLFQACRTLEDKGAKIIAIEASSHGLSQKRVQGIPFSVAALTSFSRDHLDYHGTLNNYAEAKALLFKTDSLKVQILPLGNKYTKQIVRDDLKSITFGEKKEANLFVHSLETEISGSRFFLNTPVCETEVFFPILGKFNVSNLLCALAIIDFFEPNQWKNLIKQIAYLSTTPGRMERFSSSLSADIIVDFAHTPDALEKLILSCRQHYKESKLWLVFGCGGERDIGKRSLMGQIAAKFADFIFLTDDNPRNEDPKKIVDDICKGIRSRSYKVVHDRPSAILEAVSRADLNDCIILAGKGHETTQTFSNKIIQQSDRKFVQSLANYDNTEQKK